MTRASPIDPAVALAWGLPDRAKRGPKPAFTIAEIVEAAMKIADQEGLGAVAMSRVAKTLGYSPMSLYRYVKSKDELLLHMQDAAFGVPKRQPAADAGWRQGLQTWALSLLDQLMSHPWYVDIPISGPPLMPRIVEWMDWAMSYLNQTPLTPIEKVSFLQALSGYVRNEVSVAVGLQRARANQERDPDREELDYLSNLRALVDPAAFPSVAALLDEGLLSSPADAGIEDGDEFMLSFGLQRLLDGLEALIGQRERRDSRSGPGSA